MAFAQIAKGLLQQNAIPIRPTGDKPQGRAGIMAQLDNAGFSVDEIFQDLKQLYDDTDEDSIKRGIMSDILKVRGLMQSDNQRPDAPQIIINVAGDNTKVNSMLCPSFDNA